MPAKYDKSFRDRAVRIVLDRLNNDRSLSQSAVIKEIAPRLGIADEILKTASAFFAAERATARRDDRLHRYV